MKTHTTRAQSRGLTGEVWAIFAALGFVALELTVRAAAPETPAAAGAVVRLLPIVVIAWFMALAGRGRRESFRALTRGRGRAWLWAALAVDGFLNLYLGVTLKLAALQHGSVVIALTAIEAGQLFGTAFIIRGLFGQGLTARIWLGVVLVTAGTWLASLGPGGGVGAGETLLLSVGAGLCFAVSVGAMSYALRRGVPLWSALAVSSTVGLAATTMAAVQAHQVADIVSLVTQGGAVRTFLFLSGLAYALALVSLTRAFQRTSPVAAEAISGCNGPVAALSGGLIYGPAPNLLSVVGVLVVVAGSLAVRIPAQDRARHDLLVEHTPRPYQAPQG